MGSSFEEISLQAEEELRIDSQSSFSRQVLLGNAFLQHHYALQSN